MKRIFTHLFVAVLLMLSSTSWAQLSSLEVGQIYRFVSARGARSLAADGVDDVHVKATDLNDTKQEWYVTKDGDYYVLRNVACGRFLKGAPSAYTAWSLTEDYSANENRFSLLTSNSTLNTLKTKGSDNYGHMHDDNNGDNGGYNVVGWTNADDVAGSHWTITKVNYTAEQIKALLDAAPTTAEVAAYQPSLEALFSDAACTTPKLASLSAAQSSDAYAALPASLQKMVDKVYGGNWEEATVAPADRPNGNNNTNHSLWTVSDIWNNDYAKRFRVQMYEPYSIEGEITSYLRFNAHCNMDNPTGIYANSGEVIYIMVDGDIPEGAELWLAHQSGNGATQYYNNSAYTQLHKGLNRVTFTTDGCQMWINYVVHTYNADGVAIADKFPENRKLSNYKPLKIHIEGGHINGFFNALGDFRATTDAENLWGAVDNDEDWNYYKARVALPTDFALLGHRQTLLFPFGTYNSDKKHFGVANADGGIEEALAYHLENIKVVSTPNCYSGNGNGFGEYNDTYYPGMGLSTENGKINIMLEAWDRITYSELASMGLVSTSTMDKMNALYPRWTSEGTPAEIYNYGSATVNNVTQSYKEFCQGVDYSEYFNHHACGVGAGSGYMSGGWRVCNYHYNTMESIIGKIANEAGPTWGPAHEIGHQHQAVFNLNGQTEVTNNFFSNVAVWYMGMGTSRVNGSDGSLESVLAAFNTDGNDLYTNNIWAITHLYYRLWLYYHLAGNNTQFWPRLFELCRQEPLINGGQISGETSLLRFYQHACNAAGEDLTEFFRAHGFFEIMDNRLVGDYSNAIYNVTQAQIDAAIEAVKAKNYPVNYSILLINDGTDVTTPKHNGEDKRALWDVDKSGNPIYTAEFGSVNDFISGNVATTAYTATLNSDGTITMSGGQGGVGFLVLNEKGEIVSFSNKSTFALGEEARHSLISGAATIVSVSSDNSEPVEATIDLAFVKKEFLASLIDEARAVVEGVDDTYTKVGCYKPSAVADLQAAIDVAEDAYANGTAFEGAYEVLYAEYRKVIDNPVSMIGVISGKKYAIKNKGGKDYMTVSGSNVVTTDNYTLPTTDANLWIIETAGENYHIKHAGTGKYLQGVSDADGAIFTVGDNAVDYKMTTVAIAYNALSTVEHPGKYMNRYSSSKVATWGDTDVNSQWAITLADNAADAENLANLELLASKTRELLDKVADVEYTGEGYPLQAEDPSASFYITSNATESGHEPKFLLDNSTSTFFHTVWASGSPGEAHYLQVDMGADNAIGEFVLSYTTIGQTNVDAPEVIEVKGSNSDNSGFQTIATLSSLPTTHVTPYTSGVLGNDNTKYRYLRFTVTDATGGQLSGYYYFGISEFVIKRMNYQLNGIHSDYPDATNEIVTAAIEKYEAAKLAIANGSGYADALSQLQSAYEALYNASLTVANAKKTELQALIESTKTLLSTAGEFIDTPEKSVDLSTENVYCNATIAEGKLENIFDKDNTSFIHTQWSGTSADNDYHYLRVDMGEGESIGEFYFTYTTASRANLDMPKTIVVEGANEIDDANSTKDTFTEIATLTVANDGLPQVANSNKEYTSRVLGSASTPYRYLRFRVTEISRTTGDVADDNGNPYFTMAEFGLAIPAYSAVTVKDEYKNSKVTVELLVATNDKVVASEMLMNNTTSEELLDAQIADQTAAKAALEEAMAKMTVDKTALLSLYNLALPLYNEMADGDGKVNANYEPSDLKDDMLAAAKTALDAAKTVLDSSNSQGEIDAAKDALQAQYDALLAIKDANVATTIDKSELNTAIANAKTLIAAIEVKGDGYYESVAGFGLAELSTALQNAETVIDRFYLTEAQYTKTLTQLNNCYTTTNGILALDCNSENRNNLSTLIGNVNALLTVIADAGENTQALPLQATNENEAFYIWCNEPAGDSQGVAGLIDKNADGTANTGTFLGTNWSKDVPAYTHYIEIDLGVAGTIDQLTMDYTTRNSTHADQRPNAIKILGSNDKANYNEITEITSGLAANANEKWAMATPLALGAHYRYIRIAVGSDRGFFHMVDFNLYTKLSHTLKEYYTTAEGLDLVTLCLALDEAQDAAARYMTAEQYTVVYNKLNGCYTTANTIASNDYDDRDALATLKNNATTLVNDVVTIDETETVLALQATDANAPYYIYCNAPGATNDYAGDNLGVAALLDVDDNDEPITATFLHTSYVAGSHDDALDHYLRVDMGESNLLSFKFRYTPRIGNTGNAPLVMLIEGSNDCVNFEEITTLSDMATTYQSGEITNGKAYRYIRFMVKETHNHSKFDNHEFFAMSHFEMTACKTVTISQEYASPNLSVDVAANAYNELVDANALDTERYLANEVGTTAKDELQAAYDALNAAIALQNIPVKLTTDVNNPVLYKIKINRGDNKRLQYDEASAMVAVADEYVGNKAQAWFFMSGADATKDVLILPYTGEGKVLATNSFSEGDSKVQVVESTADGYSNNWNIVAIADSEWSNITILNGSGATFYFSNHGGVSKKMGFYNTTPSTDGGSMFQFVLDETDYSLSDAYYALLNQYNDCGGEVTYGTIIGTYSEVTGTAYNTAYNTAATLLEAKNSTDDEYENARTELVAAYNALEYNGGLCKIRSAYTGGYSENNLVYVDAVNNPYFEAATDEQLSKYVWEFVPVKSGYHLKSLHTQSYITAAGWGTQVVLGNEAAARLVTVDFLDKENGIVRLNVAGGYPLHAQASDSKLVGYTGGLGTASAWYVEKVENVEDDIKHTVSLGANESGSDTKAYSTLYLAYNAKIPTGITASIVTDVNEIGQLVMEEVTGGILPANTAVVLSSANAGAADFKYTANEATFNPQGNKLRGASCNELVHCGNNYNVYMLGKKSGRVAFYWTYENRNENGVKYEVNGSTNHNEGGYVLCNANKAYLLDEENPAQAAAAMYGFLFGGTSGVDSVNADTVENTVYDLQGRKLVKVASPGIYIVNGKKVYVTEIED